MLEGLKRAIAAYDPEAAKQRYETQLAQWQKAVKAAETKAEREQLNRRRPRPPQDPRLSPGSPGRLFNGMIAPLGPLRHPRRHLVPGRVERRRMEALRPATADDDHRVAERSGTRAISPSSSCSCPTSWPRSRSPSESVGGWALIREQFLKTLLVAEHGHGHHDRHRRGQKHPPQEQTRGRPAAGAVGPGEDLRQERRGLAARSINRCGPTATRSSSSSITPTAA